jgi:hypothetical protein
MTDQPDEPSTRCAPPSPTFVNAHTAASAPAGTKFGQPKVLWCTALYFCSSLV